MKILFKLFVVFYTIFYMVSESMTDTANVIAVLVLFVFSTWLSKFGSNQVIVISLIITSSYILYTAPELNFLLVLVFFDVILYAKKWVYSILGLVILYLIFIGDRSVVDLLLMLVIVSMLAYAINTFEEKTKEILDGYDRERRYRYDLEVSKAKLLKLNSTIKQSTETMERNRIARDIHDNVGHRLSGLILELQASRKLFNRDSEKAMTLLDSGILHLSEAIDMLRNTVHNIKPKGPIGIVDIENMIKSFAFCDIEFIKKGRFGEIDIYIFEVLKQNLKESLTNIVKHSNATKVVVELESSQKYVRMMISDNGTKFPSSLREGLGLTGMKERLYNVGGTFSYGIRNGFIQANFIPLEQGDTDENNNNR